MVIKRPTKKELVEVANSYSTQPLSARTRCYYYFLNGLRPTDILALGLVKVGKKTVYKYHSDWRYSVGT
jgi:hypothetical protein